jgi:tRNA-dihydrouridine synthase C
MRIVLAPMEGLADDVMRRVLTAVGGYDWCVSEFVRVTDSVLPERAFRRISPELDHGAKTASGTPIRLQLLGSDPQRLAENAARAATLKPFGIDLNFGCPAPTVFKHRGGAALLDEPELLHAIVLAVRAAVPSDLPVTAKLRLGIRDTSRTLDCVQALEAGGAAELVVHARTKEDGYRPPAHWEWLGRVRAAVKIPVIANGEIWTNDDWQRCRAISGCSDVMIGRGAVADPFLARQLRGEAAAGWPAMRRPLLAYWAGVQHKLEARHAPGRLKYWLSLLRRRFPEAAALYAQVRVARTAAEVTALLAAAFGGPDHDRRRPEFFATAGNPCGATAGNPSRATAGSPHGTAEGSSREAAS